MTLEIVTHTIRMTEYGVCDNCMTIANDWLRLKNKQSESLSPCFYACHISEFVIRSHFLTFLSIVYNIVRF